MKSNQIAAQTYTLRDFIQTPKALGKALHMLRAIGYEAVELSGLGPMPASEAARALQGEGMTCCASHESEDVLFGNTAAVAERMQTLRCPTAVYPWPGDRRFDSLEPLRAFARKLNETGRALQDADIAFCYHNHHMEFARVDGRPALDTLFAETDPAFVKAELDTYWVQFGGGNPVAWCEKLKGRLAILHMKDYAITADRQVAFAEVGNGNLDWPAIVAAADAAGCQWFAIEQDVCPGNPFDSLRASYEFVREQLCED